ncbi:hypothetical protein ETB97_012440 [Aspergillus alliaceus]|uniref:Uncharacterized protein n=1 Tax=Petromyces alliaceus TaxID=209559 RepID=A0A8H6E6Z8_PETAA|nr:hypothetical protein ETB97_012440 [Aspergillus burnettii]
MDEGHGRPRPSFDRNSWKSFLAECSQLEHSSWKVLERLFMDDHCDACSYGPVKILVTVEVVRVLGEMMGPDLLEGCHDKLASTVLRLCIFDQLELTHTCWHVTNYWEWFEEGNLDGDTENLDDIPHILDEQRPLMQELETLTAKFISEYH